jgi:hypothetical protein
MRRALRFVCLGAPAVLGACDLDEITVVEVENVIIAEIYVNLAEDPAANNVFAFLHRTVGIPGSDDEELRAARIVVSRSDGLTLDLTERPPEACLESLPTIESGVCFLANSNRTRRLRPGDQLEAVVTLADGGTLLGSTRVPSSFEIDGVSPTCRLDPDTLLPVLWSSSEGAWAYINETSIQGLPEALIGEGIQVKDDPLNLLGLSISNQDTTIVFPSEFGVFERFDLAQDLAVRLQTGLPSSAVAAVSITAVDGNFVNWVRGANFNPSGSVRVPSLRGDGTGVFGSTVNRRFVVISGLNLGAIPDCAGPTP